MSIITSLLRLLGRYWHRDAWQYHNLEPRRSEFKAKIQQYKA